MLALADAPDVKVIMTFRNLPDSVVSAYHHQVNYGQTSLTLTEWLDDQGIFFARSLMQMDEWADHAFMLPFELALKDPITWLSRAAAYVDQHLSKEKILSIAGSVTVRNPLHSPHVRTGGAGSAKHELPPQWLARLLEMDAERPAHALYDDPA